MSTAKEIMRSAAYRYAEDVLEDRILAPKTIHQQAQHFLDELKRAERGGWRYTFDLQQARRPVEFCERFLVPTAGQYERFKFLPWQEFVDCQAFGWIDRDRDQRRYREVLEMVARGNGKTARASGKMGYMTTKGGERGAENYFLANSKTQAKRNYHDFYIQMRMSPVLKKRLHLLKSEALYEPDFSTVTYLGNDPFTLDGLRPYFVIKDEMEAEISFEQINQILRPMKKRRQPLMWYTMTAGTVLDGPAVYHYDYAKKILDRDPEISERAIDTYLPIIYEIDPDLPYEDPQYWGMANPSLGILLDIEELILDYERAKRSPKELADFVTKQLNRFATPPEAVFVDLDTIRRNDTRDIPFSLVRYVAYGGFDLSKSEDFTSAAVVFDLPDGDLGIEQHSWVPEEKIRRGNGREEKDWHEWQKRNWLTIVPGRYVKYDYVLNWFKEKRVAYELRGIGHDPYNATEFVKALRAEGFLTQEIIQGPRTLNAPMKSLKELLLDGGVLWGHDECFAWYLRNVRMRAGFFDLEKENWMPTKRDRFKKIDGFMAVLDAYAMRMQQRVVFGSQWEDSGIIKATLR